MKPGTNWIVRDRTRLLLALIEKLGGDAHIAFEGDLRAFSLDRLPGTSDQETPTLKRNTIWPKQDFLVMPLESSMGQDILRAISGAAPRRIIHIQIEKDGILQFGAFDNFQSLFWGPMLGNDFLASLATQGILASARPEG